MIMPCPNDANLSPTTIVDTWDSRTTGPANWPACSSRWDRRGFPATLTELPPSPSNELPGRCNAETLHSGLPDVPPGFTTRMRKGLRNCDYLTALYWCPADRRLQFAEKSPNSVRADPFSAD